ncbi:glycoside hydrolase [Gloeopeniophorella convolvens]|nr:glycoside hydrolase [Gloeopeniophorella convolvens]
MLTPIQRFAGGLRRPIVRILLFCMVIGTFLVAFFPPSTTTHWEHPSYFPARRPPPPPFRAGRGGKHRTHPHPRPPLPPPANGTENPWPARANAVRDAFVHAYSAYVAHAAPHDELRPLSQQPVDNFNGWALTLVDSLDTMWLMGLHAEFDDGLAAVANMTFARAPGRLAPFFETVIRHLGGLLAAHALSGDPILLARADDLGTALLPAFGTASGLPMYAVNTATGAIAHGWMGAATLWAEALSCQLEYKYLAYLTGRTEYYHAVDRIMELMYAANVSATAGLFPTVWNTAAGTPSTKKVSVGAFADSAYEYMLKQWLLTGRTDAKARDLYASGADGALRPSHAFEHLSCFLPGMLALGAATLPSVPRTHMLAARGLAHTCWTLYADSPSGLAPDIAAMRPAQGEGARWAPHVAAWEAAGAQGDPPGVAGAPPLPRGATPAEREYGAGAAGYLLRPETVESMYLLWRTTGDAVWRERGWAVFEAVRRAARVPGGGFASVVDVYAADVMQRDEMPSWFLAETLKYLYLLFSDDELVPLDQWVFNTEAHPLPVFEWSDWERERYGIP